MKTSLRHRVWAVPAGVLLGALVSGCQKPSAAPVPAPSATSRAYNGADISRSHASPSLRLPDMNGRVRTLADFKGKVVVLFFGYTQCPDVCPVTLAALEQVKKSLGPLGERVQGLFVTVDPERDTPQLLKSYVTAFDPSFLALRGTPAQTQETAKAFEVYYFKVPGKTPGSYSLDHSAGSIVIDTRGQERLFEVYGQDTGAFAADIRALLAEGGGQD
jgi:protein SCO1/2